MPYNEGMQCFSLCGKQKIRKGERIYEHENENANAKYLALRKFKGGFKVKTLKVKSISVMLIFSMMLAMFMPLFPVKVYAAPDTRTQITKINLNVVSGTAVAEYGETVAHPNLEIVSTEPASAKDYLSVSGALWYQGSSWVTSDTFGEGEYYLLVRINLSDTSKYKFDSPTNIMYIDGTRLSSSGVGDSYLINRLSFNLESPDGTAPTITTTSLLEYAIKGDAYSATLTATGSKPITWSLKSGSSLPSGLNLTSNGVISGTPTVSGDYDFTVVATNSAGSVEKNLSLKIKNLQKITRINLHATSGTTVAEYGETVAHPNLEIVSTEPASAKDYLSVGAYWYKGNSWVTSDTFGEGEYYLHVSINLSDTNKYYFGSPTNIMYIDGTQLKSNAVGTNYIKNDLRCNVTSTATTHEVTFISNGGTSVTQQEVIHGETATEPSEPTRFGHSFAGWYSDSTLLTPFDFSTPIKNNTSIYAKWNVAHKVTFNLDGGTWTDTGTNPQVVNHGETAIRPTNPTKSGHVFAGWYADSACTTPFSFLTAITSNKTIYAKWNIITNSVNAILSPTPSVGLTIGDLVLTSGDSSKYSVSAGYWKLNDSGSALDKSSTQFEAGQTYTLYLTYYPENGYNIPDDATYTVNGIPTEWSGFEAKSNRKISFTIPAPATQISELSATVTAPVGGEHPSFTVTVPDGAHYTAVVDTWYDLNNNGAHLTNSDTFVTGNEYQARIHFTANTGYEIANSASYTINGTPNYAAFDTAEQRGMNFVATAPAVTTYTVSGSVTSFNDASGDITLQLIPEGLSEPAYETTVKGNTVAYSFADVAAGTYTLKVSKANHVTREYTVVVGNSSVLQDAKIHLLGDINGDGKVTTIDFGRANSHAKGVAILTGYELLCVDTVKQDGLVTTADAGRVNAHARGTSLLW